MARSDDRLLDKRGAGTSQWRDGLPLLRIGNEQHSIAVDEDMFVKWVAPNWKEFYRKSAAYPLYYPKQVDVRLKPDAIAIDKGVVLPNVNEHFHGEAPDLGAIEFGDDAPVCGLRVKKSKNNSKRIGRHHETPTFFKNRCRRAFRDISSWIDILRQKTQTEHHFSAHR